MVASVPTWADGGVTPAAALEAMLGFHRDSRVQDSEIAADGDMLLFEWGYLRLGGGGALLVPHHAPVHPFGVHQRHGRRRGGRGSGNLAVVSDIGIQG